MGHQPYSEGTGMAWIEKRRCGDGGVSARVLWRLGGTRDGARQVETFAAGTDAQNLARAEGFKKMVDAAGQRWPDGWVKGEGFVRPVDEDDPMATPPRFVDLAEEYDRQVVDLSPGTRKRYLGHLGVLEATRIRGSLIFTKPVTAITEADLKEWLIDWDRSLKTKANYHGLIQHASQNALTTALCEGSPTLPSNGSRPAERARSVNAQEVNCLGAVVPMDHGAGQ